MHNPKHNQTTYRRWFYTYLLNSSAFVLITRCDKLDPKKAAKILLHALNISAFFSIIKCSELDFNTIVKIWLNALDISADTQKFLKKPLKMILVGKDKYILALKIGEFI